MDGTIGADFSALPTDSVRMRSNQAYHGVGKHANSALSTYRAQAAIALVFGQFMANLLIVRSLFPAFSEPSLQGFAHFENAGGSYACGPVIERLDRYYRQTKVQPYHDFPASREAGHQMDSARSRMAAWLNVATEVHFGPSTSQNTYVIAQALRQHLKPGDEVVVTNQDHEANIGAWRRLESAGIVVREWKIDPDSGELDPDDLDTWLCPRTRVVAFTHCSNVVASINPVRELTDRIHAAGAIAIVDGVSTVTWATDTRRWVPTSTCSPSTRSMARISASWS
jgi:selenocysteine lyase/cysteine desulfurase